jgi:hypothetical protein
VECKLDLGERVVKRERQHPPVRKPDTPCLALLPRGSFNDHGGGPVHVVERQARIRERFLPGRFLVAGLPLRLNALDRLGQARLGATELLMRAY